MVASKGASMGQGTEYAKLIRSQMRARRKDLDLSLERVGELVAQDLGRSTPYGKSAVSGWERFVYHPPIDVFAAWARVLRGRLHVWVDFSGDDRVRVAVPQDRAQLCREIGRLDAADVEVVRQMVERLAAPR